VLLILYLGNLTKYNLVQGLASWNRGQMVIGSDPGQVGSSFYLQFYICYGLLCLLLLLLLLIIIIIGSNIYFLLYLLYWNNLSSTTFVEVKFVGHNLISPRFKYRFHVAPCCYFKI
jgi:hypothetical protein